jgi:ferredoxin
MTGCGHTTVSAQHETKEQIMAYLPVVDEAACSAHGDCEHVAPSVFRVDDFAVVVGAGTREEILAAAEACPAGAISVVDGDTGEPVYP